MAGHNFKLNKKTAVCKLPRVAIYEPLCVQLINNPFCYTSSFGIVNWFAIFLINTLKGHFDSKSPSFPSLSMWSKGECLDSKLSQNALFLG